MSVDIYNIAWPEILVDIDAFHPDLKNECMMEYISRYSRLVFAYDVSGIQRDFLKFN